MKKILPVFFLLTSTLASAQNYSLFNSSSKKLFITNTAPFNTYSLSFDSVLSSGNDSVFYDFFGINIPSSPTPSVCPFWGSPDCIANQDQPACFGDPIQLISGITYRFFNLNNDTLNFDFGISQNDTSVFYSDNGQQFKIIFENSDTLTVLGNLDSVRFYRILHFDSIGNIISSTLNQQQIVVGKNLGLIKFFQVDSFPQVLKPLTLAGNNFPHRGLSALTNENVYDYQAGDELQFDEYYYYFSGPPWNNYHRFRKYIFLSRTDLQDSIIYSVHQKLFHLDSTFTMEDTIQLRYARYDTIAKIPFELYDGKDRTLTYENFCGQYLWKYLIYDPAQYIYCTDDNCWGFFDTGGPPLQLTTEYVAGFGKYYFNADQYFSSGSPFNQNAKIIYSLKNGIPCGSEKFVGIEESVNVRYHITVSPNPSNEFAEIKSSAIIDHISLIDISGRNILTQSFKKKEGKIFINSFSEGVYLISITLENGSKYYSKFIIQK